MTNNQSSASLASWLLFVVVGNVHSWSSVSRRTVFRKTASILSTSAIVQFPATPSYSADELPLRLRDFTKLAPLGQQGSTSLQDKTLNLSLEELASRLAEDLAHGHTDQGGYFISGDIDASIFRDDCVFVDPTNRVTNLSQYRNALRILFDPQESQVELIGKPQVDKKSRTIQATIRSRGVLQLPWRPYIPAYESNIVYQIDENCLIAQQSQTWSKSASAALRESFTPGINRPVPASKLTAKNEPATVTKLFDMVNGRRPNEYTQEEQIEISKLVDTIVQQQQQQQQKPRSSNSLLDNQFLPEFLPGKWMLVYLQPGPYGAGIDRRLPFFPDFDFNDNFQIFGSDSVLNVGQVLGPALQVQVSGSLSEQSPGSRTVPKRFIAQIQEGQICWQESSCLQLSIQGEGIFDSVYLGERLRIGQNINGGGARVVQVKLEND